jgi:Tol biopolymer transport system component
LSPDDRTLAVSRYVNANEADLWLIDLARGVGTRFTYGPRQNTIGVWSPGGDRIAFESNRSGPFDIYVKPTTGALPEKPLVQGGSQFKHPACWTPDGRSLVFSQLLPGTGFDIWTVPGDGSGPPVPYLQTPFHENFPFLSPDGRWMLYTSDESGRPELYVQSFPTLGHKYQITTGGCFIGEWRSDGKEIVMNGLDGQTFLSSQVLESGETFRASPPRLLFRGPPNAPGFAMTRDGQRFLLPVPDEKATAQTITVVLDWQAALAAHAADRP